MSQKIDHQDTTQFNDSLCDMNLLGLWAVSGSEWSTSIREDCSATVNQPVDQETSSAKLNKLLLVGFVGFLTLFSAAVLTLNRSTSPAVQVNHEMPATDLNSLMFY
ncbi:hypothetical protein [Coleofasciculus sp. G2-EDA-02]|uniref:hypothetical protein n=1 Tax=Coleofasciculus sp. G2-EDA-02 TaxID=3069529 RepID=UPI0033010D2A